MKRQILYLVVGVFFLQGCAMYPAGNIPKSGEITELTRDNGMFRPKCLIKNDVSAGNAQMAEWLRPVQQNAYADVLQESGLFESCVGEAGIGDVDVTIRATSSYVQDLDGAILTGLSLMTIPFATEHRFTLAFDVSDRSGKMKQYRFKETVVERFGLLLIFALPTVDGAGASYDEAFTAMYRNAMRAVLVKMRKDGFFSMAERAKAAEKDAVAETLKKTVAARRKELEDLKKAGIIDEAEFAAEVKKLEGAGK